MSKATRQLRLIQAVCIGAVVACAALAYFGTNRTRRLGLPTELCISLAAVWSAVGGFTVQRKLGSKQFAGQRARSKGTPFTRWRAGNIIRLWTAASVGMWALVLAELELRGFFRMYSLRLPCYFSFSGHREPFQPIHLLHRNFYSICTNSLGCEASAGAGRCGSLHPSTTDT